MEQYYSHYKNWEDFQNGMYRMNVDTDKDIFVFNAINLLKSEVDFYNSCKAMLNEWQVSAKVNMTNKSQNRNAWLGAAACCYAHQTPEYLTRIAWSLMNRSDQDKANKIADRIILEYERKNIAVYQDVGSEGLF
jgi:hypothetical protein